VKKVSKRKQT